MNTIPKICIAFGTRPEILKLSSLCAYYGERGGSFAIMSGQHTSLFDSVSDLISKPKYHINGYPTDRSLSEFAGRYMTEIDRILAQERPDLILVQGDTTTAFVSALAGFHRGIAIGHLEAGLRTYDPKSPFPEEINRQLISRIATLNFCPTELSREILRNERVPGTIHLTGNTIVDFVNQHLKAAPEPNGNKVVITLHRRENSKLFSHLLKQIDQVAAEHPELCFVFPAHPTPELQRAIRENLLSHITVTPPMGYRPFLNLLSETKFIISDSGGIQEEAVCLRKKTLVCRNTTERPEGIDVGICRLVGDNILPHIQWALDPISSSEPNPYGDGQATARICEAISAWWSEGRNGSPAPF